MTPPAPPVWVVLLDYNTGPLLSGCIDSFLGVPYPALKILLVDNASTDGIAMQVAARHPEVEFIRLTQNTGYCGGNNAGIERALQQGAAHVMVVNPDIRVINPDFIAELVRAMARLPQAGIVGPLVHFREEGTLQNTNCQLPYLKGKLKARFRRQAPSMQVRPAAEREVEVLNGVCVLLRREMLLEVGAYDQNIFMYGEDWDLTMRSLARGWKSYQIPVDSIVHLQKQAGYDYLSMTNFLLKRNAAYVLLKHGHRLDALMVALGGWTLSLARAMKASVGHANASKYWAFLGRLGRAYLAAFRGKTRHPDFGPPTVDWTRL